MNGRTARADTTTESRKADLPMLIEPGRNPRRRTLHPLLLSVVSLCALALAIAAPAHADFGIAPESFDGAVLDDADESFTTAGGHPYEASTTFMLNSINDPELGPVPDGAMKEVSVDLPPGLIGNPTVVPTCPDAVTLFTLSCPPATQVGYMDVTFGVGIPFPFSGPVFAMKPLHGFAARFGVNIAGVLVYLNGRLRTDGEYRVGIDVVDVSQGLAVLGSKVTLWGTPADPVHDVDRGYGGPFGEACIQTPDPECSNPSGVAPRAFVSNPTSCPEPGFGLSTVIRVSSWDGRSDADEFISHAPPGYPLPVGSWGPLEGPDECDVVPLDPTAVVQQTTDQAHTPTGLEFELNVPDLGLLNPTGVRQADIKKTEVTLPEGVTINPSAAEGMGSCSLTELDVETLESLPGSGCPNSSRLGAVEIDTPLLEERLLGSVYLAEPDDPQTIVPGAENPFDSLLGLHIVARNAARGVIIKLSGSVELDPRTGQVVTTFDDLPQLPFSRFHLKFREGGRAPLVSPAACGTYETKAEFTPWSAADPDNPTADEVVTRTSQFQVTRGVGGGACPSGGLPPFKPGLIAGTRNNDAGSYSPFDLRLFRNDGEQEFTHFSIKLPPGVTGKLAGLPFCPDAAIEASKLRSGAAELASSACPAASEVGRTLVGAGVGSVLTYVPGKVYLAGPYNGSAMSVVAITAAKVGPFDLGTVVVRQALKVNPDTAEVFIDATGSDPIPHIIDGITTHLRDIRVYVERPEFVLNPTSCDSTSTASTVLGSGLDFGSVGDDRPITVTTRFQAANCARLAFKPRLRLSLSGGTKRGDNPKFKAVLNARPGDANIGAAQVTLPHSAFLDQSHIKTICTRVQFAAGAGNGAQCPKASIYGYAKAVTPLLDEPLEGPVFLRSSSHNLPDLLVALRSGKINVNLAGRIDSVGDGQIRNTFEEVPDAPVTRFTLTMQGGKKGLLVNSANLCARKNRAIANFTGQNGKLHKFNPVLKAPCSKKAKAKAKKKR